MGHTMLDHSDLRRPRLVQYDLIAMYQQELDPYTNSVAQSLSPPSSSNGSRKAPLTILRCGRSNIWHTSRMLVLLIGAVRSLSLDLSLPQSYSPSHSSLRDGSDTRVDCFILPTSCQPYLGRQRLSSPPLLHVHRYSFPSSVSVDMPLCTTAPWLFSRK